MRDIMSVLLKSALNEELGCPKYNYRNDHSPKTMHTSYDDMNMTVPVTATVSIVRSSLMVSEHGKTGKVYPVKISIS